MAEAFEKNKATECEKAYHNALDVFRKLGYETVDVAYPDLPYDMATGIIVDAEGTRANRREETAITETMLARVMTRFSMRPKRLAGDTAYGTGYLLRWLFDRNITPHIPVWDKSVQQNGMVSKADFTFDRERNVYVCPAGKHLTHSGLVDQV